MDNKNLGFSHLSEGIIDGVIIVQDGYIVWVNSHLIRILGYFSEAELLGQPITNFIAPEYLDLVLRRYNERMSGEDTLPRYKVKLLKKEGERVRIELSSQRIDIKGKLSAMVILRDIENEYEMTQALEKSIDKFKKITEITTDIIWEIDQDQKIKYVNQSFVELLNYDVPEIIGKQFIDITPVDEKKSLKKFFDSLIKNKQSFSFYEHSFLDVKGHVLSFESSAIPVFNQKGKLSGYYGVSRDITNKKRVLNTLINSYKEIGFVKRQLDLLSDINRVAKTSKDKSAFLLFVLTCIKNITHSPYLAFYEPAEEVFRMVENINFPSRLREANNTYHRDGELVQKIKEKGCRLIDIDSEMGEYSIFPMFIDGELKRFVLYVMGDVEVKKPEPYFCEIFGQQVLFNLTTYFENPQKLDRIQTIKNRKYDSYRHSPV